MANKKLFFISHYNLADTPHADLLLPALARNSWDITVVAPGAESSLLRREVPYPCIAKNLTKQSGASLWERETETLSALLKARLGSYDVIFVHSPSLSLRASFALAGPLGKTKLVYHNPDFIDPLTYPLSSKIEGILCRKAHCHINHEWHRGYIYRTLHKIESPVFISPPSLPAAWPIPAESQSKRIEMCGGADKEAFVLMLQGAYSEIRMVPQLFEALALLPQHFRLVMTGADVRKTEVDAFLQKLQLCDRVVRLPFLTYAQLFEYTVNADAGILLYQNNDLGNYFQSPGRLTQYLACGLPVLTNKYAGLENLVNRFDFGVCVDAEKPDSIANGIKKIEEISLANKHIKYEMRQCFLNHFAIDHWEPIICQAFDNLLNDRPIKSHLSSAPWFPD